MDVDNPLSPEDLSNIVDILSTSGYRLSIASLETTTPAYEKATATKEATRTPKGASKSRAKKPGSTGQKKKTTKKRKG